MKIDLYLKVVLTVIALCFVYIVAKDLPLASEAQASSEVIDVNIVSIDGNRFSSENLPVKIFGFSSRAQMELMALD